MKGGDHGFARRRARRQPPRARPLLPVKKSLIRHLGTWLWAAAMILAQPEGWAAAPALARGRRGAAWGPGLAISTGPGGLGGLVLYTPCHVTLRLQLTGRGPLLHGVSLLRGGRGTHRAAEPAQPAEDAQPGGGVPASLSLPRQHAGPAQGQPAGEEGRPPARRRDSDQVDSVVSGPSRASNGQRGCVLRSRFPFISFWGFQTFFGGLC